MKVVLSIKPEYAYKIFEGTKKFEFRRSIFKNKSIETVIVYASSPVKKVIGEFEIEFILNHELEHLWNLTQKQAGISKSYFLDYFRDKKDGYAIKIKTFNLYSEPRCLKKVYNLAPPQSFAYFP